MNRILYIGNKLSKHGNTPTSIETLGVFFEQEGYEVYYASDKRNSVLRFLDMVYSVFIYRNKVDFVLIDTYSTVSFWYTFAVSQVCRLLSLRYLPILRGGNLPHRLDSNQKLCQMVFNHSYKNIAPSNYLMDAFSKRNYPNLFFIPNTLDLENYSFTKKREIQIPKLLWVRSFATLYNPHMAIDVLKEVQKVHPSTVLCMVGPDKDGSLETTRKYAASQQVNVIFTGGLSKTEWITLSQNYNIFINTTHFDNTPVSVMEALCLGLPVITTNVGGIPFLLENRKNAMLVPDGAITEMTDAVLELMDDVILRDSLVCNGRAYMEGFDWNIVKKRWAEVFTGQI